MLKIVDLKKKNTKDLTGLLESKKKDLWNFRFGASGSKMRNVKEGQTLRRDIARIKTLLSEQSK